MGTKKPLIQVEEENLDQLYEYVKQYLESIGEDAFLAVLSYESDDDSMDFSEFDQLETDPGDLITRH